MLALLGEGAAGGDQAAAVYTRVRTGKRAEAGNLERRDCASWNEYAARKGYRVVLQASDVDADLDLIRWTVNRFSTLNCLELGQTICEDLPWKAPCGKLRIHECLPLLEQLNTAGIIALPAKRDVRRRPGCGAKRWPRSGGLARFAVEQTPTWAEALMGRAGSTTRPPWRPDPFGRCPRVRSSAVFSPMFESLVVV